MYSSIMKPAFESAASVLDPFADGFRVEAELGAALRCRPARRDHVVGGLAPELVGVPGGWVRHGTVSSVVVGMHVKASKSLACASEKTIRVASWAPHAPGYRLRADKFGIVIEEKARNAAAPSPDAATRRHPRTLRFRGATAHLRKHRRHAPYNGATSSWKGARL
jgi:hypothetical protein